MKTVFYVAVTHYSHEAVTPIIIEKFEQRLDAECFADLMSRAKQRKYIVLEQKYETAQSK